MITVAYMEIQHLEMKDFIWIEHNSLDPDFCSYVIDKFEKDIRKKPGLIGRGDINKSIKSSTDFMISYFLDEWKEEDKVLFEAINSGIQKFRDKLKHVHQNYDMFRTANVKDLGYQIQRTLPGEFYTWHHDSEYTSKDGVRILTYIWYLNDITEDGYTEFIDGTRIQPETGKLIIFPATWSFLHRGYPPKKETKYICTGWVYDGLMDQ